MNLCKRTRWVLMATDEPPPKLLLDSLASKPMPKWMMAAGITLGLYMLYKAAALFSADGPSGRVALNLLLGLVCVYGSGISRGVYIADVGIVREMISWGRVTRRVARWEEVKYVSLAFRGENMMAFFEIDIKGWKVPFLKHQQDELMDILDELLPYGVEVKTLENR